MNVFYSLNNLSVENVSTQREQGHRSWHSLEVLNIFLWYNLCTSLQAFNFWIFSKIWISHLNYINFSRCHLLSPFSLPLIFPLNCHYFEKGEIERESEEKVVSSKFNLTSWELQFGEKTYLSEAEHG